MGQGNFKITRVNGTLVLEKDGNGFTICQGIDDDIFFTTSKEKLSLDINMYSRNYSEWQIYMVFENLMKSVVGRYILSGDSAKEDSRLPEDFINLDERIISWHSDSEFDNILKLNYDKSAITVSILKSKNSSQSDTNSVRIRTDGSNYGCYYQEFLDFFARISELEYSLNKNSQSIESKLIQPPNQKKLLFFKKNKR